MGNALGQKTAKTQNFQLSEIWTNQNILVDIGEIVRVDLDFSLQSSALRRFLASDCCGELSREILLEEEAVKLIKQEAAKVNFDEPKT